MEIKQSLKESKLSLREKFFADLLYSQRVLFCREKYIWGMKPGTQEELEAPLQKNLLTFLKKIIFQLSGLKQVLLQELVEIQLIFQNVLFKKEIRNQFPFPL